MRSVSLGKFVDDKVIFFLLKKLYIKTKNQKLKVENNAKQPLSNASTRVGSSTNFVFPHAISNDLKTSV